MRGNGVPRDLPYPTLQTKFAGIPHRQPVAPPDNTHVQQHEGFVRFLKQHASPPHHRVTAGGRIVPAGPYTPPPMFDYASLRGSNDYNRLLGRSMQAQENSVRTTSNNALWSQLQSSPFEQQFQMANKLQPLGSSGQVPQNPGLLNAMNGIIQTFPGQANNSWSQYPPLVPLGTFEDGSLINSCYGMFFRTYWIGNV